MRTTIWGVLFFMVLAAGPQGRASEVDQFTKRASVPADSTELLDAIVNERMSAAVDFANRGKKKCDEGRLYRKIDLLLGDGPYPRLEYELRARAIWAPQTRTRISESIYASTPLKNRIMIHQSGLAPVFLVNGVQIGADKIGHFFGEGRRYFALKNPGQILALHRRIEEGWQGYATTGVKSYGDLSANFTGLEFWSRVLHGPEAYVSCGERGFSKIARFTFRDYVSAAWDEGLNCDDFVSRKERARVLKAIGELGMSCPVDNGAACAAVVASVPCAYEYLNPECVKQAGVAREKLETACEDYLKEVHLCGRACRSNKFLGPILGLGKTLRNVAWKETLEPHPPGTSSGNAAP
jgi:hypothetical protein